MSQSEPNRQLAQLNVKFADAPDLPIHHVNVMSVHSGSDEFFLTLGVIVPPDQEDLAAIMEAGHIVAQPIYRFAVSRDNMEKLLQLMAQQFEQQTALRSQLYQQSSEDQQEGD